jgi:hypothetical protein
MKLYKVQLVSKIDGRRSQKTLALDDQPKDVKRTVETVLPNQKLLYVIDRKEI